MNSSSESQKHFRFQFECHRGAVVTIWFPQCYKQVRLPSTYTYSLLPPEGIAIRHVCWCVYDNRLDKLGLMRLSDRRVRSDLIETFKIVSDMYNV